jgi:hypothetical protein
VCADGYGVPRRGAAGGMGHAAWGIRSGDSALVFGEGDCHTSSVMRTCEIVESRWVLVWFGFGEVR